jgi:hypothetical protein
MSPVITALCPSDSIITLTWPGVWPGVGLICQLNMAFSSCLHRVEETSSARVEVLDIPLSRRSPRQDDFAKRPILD